MKGQRLASVLFALFLCAVAEAQEGEGKDALAKAAHEAGHIATTLRQLEGQVTTALEAARAARQAAGGNAQLAAAATQLEKQVATLQQALSAVTTDLVAAQQAAAELAPPEIVAALQAARQRFDEAARMRDPEDSQRAFEALARDLAKPTFDGNDEALCMAARATFWSGEMLRARASLYMQQGKAVQGEKLLSDAIKQYEAVMDGPEVRDSSEGSSLTAVAVHRIIITEGSFYERYTRFRNDPRVWPRVRAKAARCRERSVELFEQLGRLHADDTMNGQLVTEVVRADIARLAVPQFRGHGLKSQ